MWNNKKILKTDELVDQNKKRNQDKETKAENIEKYDQYKVQRKNVNDFMIVEKRNLGKNSEQK